MKKSLIALAVLAASGAAMAQSSVTLYGVADIAVGKTNRAGLGLANDKFQAIATNTLNNGTSRFGLRGSEDLGGGLKAGFNFEAGLSLANGAGNFSGGQLFSRAANVSLAGGFGEVRAGRGLTPSFYSVATWELTGTANYSAAGNQFGFVGAGPRDSGLIMYTSPNFSGFKVIAGTVMAGNSFYTVGTAGKAKYDLAGIYENGPIAATIAYNKVTDGNKGLGLGAKYNAGAFAVAGSYTNYENAAGATLAKGFTIGATTKLGPVDLTLDIARDTKFKDTDWVLEGKYALSKRTFVYGVAMRDGKGKTALNVNGYSVGVRHNF